MNAHPPIPFSKPPRRSASGRLLGLIVASLLVLVSAACRPEPPPSATAPATSPASSPAGSPAGSPASRSAGLAAHDGLLVAAGGPLQIMTADGSLGTFDERAEPVVEVSAGGGVVIVVDPASLAWLGTSGGANQVAWRRFELPTDEHSQRPLLAVSPDGATIALATGPLQGRSFNLVLIDVASHASRSIPVDRGLNGPPAWLGLGSIAINVLGHDLHAGFVTVDATTGVVSDLPTVGFSIATSADGLAVALDESSTGDALVGTRANLDAGNVAGMTRIPSPPGFAADTVALSRDGTRLAIVRRSDQATSVEVLELIDAAWTRRTSLTLGADAVPSIAWLR